jgi:hypothetical protein
MADEIARLQESYATLRRAYDSLEGQLSDNYQDADYRIGALEDRSSRDAGVALLRSRLRPPGSSRR